MAGDIGYKDDRVRPRSDIVVKISGEFRARNVLSEDRYTTHLALLGRQQALLECTRFGKFLFHALQMLPVFAVESSQLQTALNQTQQHLAIERLLKKVKRIFPNRARQLGVDVVNATGHEDHVHFRIQSLQLLHQLEPIEVRHLNVENRQIRFELSGQLNRVTGQAHGRDFVVLMENALDGPKHSGLVIYYENARHTHAVLSAVSLRAGNAIRISVPTPGWLSIFI